MSIEVMTLVFNRYPGGGNERLLALALADQADKHGTRIFPSVATLATMSAQSERSVQRLLHVMLETGWLQLVRKSSGRRGDCNEYRISPEWIAGGEPIRPPAVPDRRTTKKLSTGANLSPVKPVDKLSTTGDTQGLSGDTQGLSGDTAVSPNPVLPGITQYPLTPVGTGAVDNQEDRNSRTPNSRSPKAPWRWERSFDGVCERGEQLGIPYSTAPLGTCYTDDQLRAHRKAYERLVHEAHREATQGVPA